MNKPVPAPAAPPAQKRPQRRPYGQIDYIRDATLIFYIVYQLSGGLQALFLGGSGGALNQIVTFAMLGVGVLCCLFDRVSHRRILHGIWPFVLPAMLILFSVTWSDYPDIGLRRAIRFTVELAGFVFLISAFRDSRSFLRAMWIAFSILLMLDVAALAKPSMSMTALGYAGIHIHKNSMGSFGYLAAPLFFIAWRQRYAGKYSIISLGFLGLISLFLLASLSKTSMALVPVCAVAAFVGYSIWARGFSTQIALSALFLIAVAGLAMPFSSGGLNVAELIGSVTGDTTMTGRTGVWDYTFWRVGERTLTGVGYGSFWEVNDYAGEVLQDFGVYFLVNQSHNGYVGTFAELGWLGIGVIAIMWALSFSTILRRIGNRAEYPIVGYALYTSLGYMIYNISETSFFRAGYDTWIHYMMMMLAVAKLAAPAGQQQRAQTLVRRPSMQRPRPGMSSRPQLRGPSP